MNALVDLLLQHGLLLVAAVTLAARAGLPLPAAPLLVVAGGLAATGQFGRLGGPALLLVAVLANVGGDLGWYWGGRRYGHRVMRLLCRVSLSPDSCVRQSEQMIQRWGGSALLAAKFVPGVSVVAAPMAGALGMSWTRFLVNDTVASALWSLLYLVLGWVFQQQISDALELMAGAGLAALGLLLLGVAVFVAWRWLRRWRKRRSLAVQRIAVVDLRRMLAEGDVPVLVDVRGPGMRQVDPRRIPGAISLSLDALVARAADWPPGQAVVTYCSCPDEATAAEAARRLHALGHARAWPLAGGLEAWSATPP